MVSIRVTLVCSSELIWWLDQLSWIMIMTIVELSMLWSTSFAHLKILGRRSMFIMWASLPAHWVEKVGPNELNIMCCSCGVWYCVRFVRYVRGLEK